MSHFFQFLEGMGDISGYIVDALWKNTMLIFGITGLIGDEFRTLYNQSTVPQFVKLLQSPNASAVNYAVSTNKI